ncbi:MULTISPECIES: hypothetical protein [unclassified Solwaraspora]|uniref:hypothetical protein n=1 Tax=unclassified Solwaraspora TaxID=2627926 RepID=UPI00259B6580|nr:hypothetical protein [Solwaraspora sp. WMMA2056]WJK42365.1 hypothetical protein O7608_08295 [Solwaraspora sp. WMMA2056]
MAILRASGKVTFLRVHDVGGGYGPPDDRIDGELVATVSGKPQHAAGTTLRADSSLPSHEGMLALLRDGLVHHSTLETSIDYDLDTAAGRRNGRLLRVELRPA